MKKVTLLLGLIMNILLNNSLIYCQTIVSGNVTGIWTPDASPYIINGNVFVIDSLIINPGVTVQFNAGGFKIETGSNDKFIARGTPNNQIIFEPYIENNPGSWNTIYLNNSGVDDTLEYCTIKYASIGINGFDSAPVIKNCTIFGCSSHGVYLQYYHNVGEPEVSNCEIFDNNNGITFRPYDRHGEVRVDARIYKCNIYDNKSNGVYIYVGTYWNGGYAYGNAKVTNCTIFNNKTGIRAYAYRGNADATITNTILAFNKEYGIANQDKGIIAPDDITYNCLWGNPSGNFSKISSKEGFGQTGPYINANGDSCDINLNIYFDPLFVDTLNSNFAIQPGSKCIDAGNSIIYDQYVLDPDGTFPEIGSYYFEKPEDNPPSVVVSIPDTTFAEDSGLHLISEDLNTVFYDPDGDDLTFSAFSDNASILPSVHGDSLFVTSLENYFGSGNVFVTATDPGGLSARDTFMVTITPVNDAPKGFNLISPENNITITSSNDSIKFVWDSSEDVDNDTILYDLKIWSSGTDTMVVPDIPDTTKWVDGTDFFVNDVEYKWTVLAKDGFTITSAIDTFTFKHILTGIGTLSNLIPDKYSLVQNYPNPFNPTTTIKYALPKAGKVKLEVFNLLGQKVVALVNGFKQTGYHQVTFDGSNLPSGVYYYRLQTDGGFVQTRKLVLLK